MHDTTYHSVLCPTYKNKHPCKYKYRQSEIVQFALLLGHNSLDTRPSILGYSIYYTTLTLEYIAMNLYV
jgi:hypothetical protein